MQADREGQDQDHRVVPTRRRRQGACGASSLHRPRQPASFGPELTGSGHLAPHGRSRWATHAPTTSRRPGTTSASSLPIRRPARHSGLSRGRVRARVELAARRSRADLVLPISAEMACSVTGKREKRKVRPFSWSSGLGLLLASALTSCSRLPPSSLSGRQAGRNMMSLVKLRAGRSSSVSLAVGRSRRGIHQSPRCTPTLPDQPCGFHSSPPSRFGSPSAVLPCLSARELPELTTCSRRARCEAARSGSAGGVGSRSGREGVCAGAGGAGDRACRLLAAAAGGWLIVCCVEEEEEAEAAIRCWAGTCRSASSFAICRTRSSASFASISATRSARIVLRLLSASSSWCVSIRRTSACRRGRRSSAGGA